MSESPAKIENGYLRIANDLQAALCRTHLSGNARRVFDAIVLKTYGWNKVSDAIALSQFVELTGLPKSTICRAMRELVGMKMILKRSGEPSVFEVNNHFGEWDVDGIVNDIDKNVNGKDKQNRQRPLTKPSKNVDETVNKGVTKLSHTKDTVTKDKKDTSTRDSDAAPPPQPTIDRIVNEPTPAEIARSFFESEASQAEVVRKCVETGLGESRARQEVQKFVLYWTEPTKSGKKQRWETEKTFEVTRRLVTWFSRIDSRFGSSGKKVSTHTAI